MQTYDYFVSLLCKDGETFFSNTEQGTNFFSFKLSTFVTSLLKFSSINLSSLFSSILFWYGVYLSDKMASKLYPMNPTTAATGNVTYGAYVRRKVKITGSILHIWNSKIQIFKGTVALLCRLFQFCHYRSYHTKLISSIFWAFALCFMIVSNVGWHSTTWQYIPEGRTLHNHRFKNLKSFNWAHVLWMYAALTFIPFLFI